MRAAGRRSSGHCRASVVRLRPVANPAHGHAALDRTCPVRPASPMPAATSPSIAAAASTGSFGRCAFQASSPRRDKATLNHLRGSSHAAY